MTTDEALEALKRAAVEMAEADAGLMRGDPMAMARCKKANCRYDSALVKYEEICALRETQDG